MELRCWLEHGNITKQIQFKYKRNLKEIHVFAARTYTQTQAQSCKQEIKKELYPFSSSCVCARVYISYVYLYATTVLKRKSPLQVRFVMNLGGLWSGRECLHFPFFFSFAFQQQQREIPYLAKVDESLDLVTELETSEFHDQFHQQSALRARSQN